MMGSLGGKFEILGYPKARRQDSVVDNYHGKPVYDPYRWLEDSVSSEVTEFVSAQGQLTESVLEKCETREKLKEKISRINERPRYGIPFRRGDKYLYFHKSKLQAHNIQDGLDANPEVVFEPNDLGDDCNAILKVRRVSDNAEFLAVGMSCEGSDLMTINVVRLSDRTRLPDTVSRVKYSRIAWTPDNKGFFYCRFPDPDKPGISDTEIGNTINENHQLYYHFLGTDQSEDILCWEDPEHPKWMLHTVVTEDGKYVILYINEGYQPANMVYYCSIDSLPHGLEGFKGKTDLLPFQKLISKFEAHYYLVVNSGTHFTFQTNQDAPNGKIVRVDIRKPNMWMDVVKESKSDVLISAHAVNKGKILVNYLRHVTSVLQVRDLQSGKLLHDLPIELGTVSSISTHFQDNMAFIGFRSFLTPGIIYKCDLDAEKPILQVFKRSPTSGFNPDEFDLKQVFVPNDGTKIPMFILSKKDLDLNGRNPALLYGYGGFNISITPSFYESRLVLAKHLGVVCAFANVRGGGEYGHEWHKSGARSKKQNCFNDFIACAEFLISEGYTQSRKLCIEGASNGGLLVAACANQRPDLFGCVLAQSGVMDMLRFHKFTIGHTWIAEFGCSDNEQEFHWLYKYSPLHTVRRPWEMPCIQDFQYPATMLLIADNDDRVLPLHSLKLLATLQYVLCQSMENSPQTRPIILRIDTKSGHSNRGSTQKRISREVDKYAFMAEVLDASWFE